MRRALILTTCALLAAALIPGAPVCAQTQSESDIEQGERALLVAEGALAGLARDGDDVAALFGRLTPEHRERVLRRARTIIAALDGAERALEERLLSIESSESFAQSDALQEEAARIGVDLLEVRLPTARAHALLIESSLVPRGENTARRALDELAPLDFGEAPAEAWRRTLLAVAMGLLGAPDTAEALASARSLAIRFEEDPTARRAGALATIALAAVAASQGPRAAQTALEDITRFAASPEEALLLHAAAADLLFRAALAGTGPIAERLDRAAGAHVALLTDERLGASAAQRKAVVFERLRRWRDLAREDAWPPAMKAAVAMDAAVPASEAARLAEQAVAASRSDTIIRESMWTAARRRAEAQDFLPSLRWCSALADRTQDSDRIREALALGRAVAARAPSSPERDDALASLLRAGLETLEAGEADAVRVELAALLERGAIERESLLRAVGSGSPSYPAAQALLAEDALAAGDAEAALERAGAAVEGAGSEALRAGAQRLRLRALLALERFAPAAEAAIALRALDPDTADAEAVRLAAALTDALREARVNETDPAPLLAAADTLLSLELPLDSLRAETLLARKDGPGAAALFASLIDAEGRRPWLLLGRADALRQAGDAQAAFAVYRELARGLERAAAHDSPIYWSAWASIIEILADRAEDDATDTQRAVVIRRELSRLLAIDPALAGDPFRARFERAASRAGVSIDALRM